MKELARIKTAKGYAYLSLVTAFGLTFGVDTHKNSQNDYVLIFLCFSLEWKGLKQKSIKGVTSIN